MASPTLCTSGEPVSHLPGRRLLRARPCPITLFALGREAPIHQASAAAVRHCLSALSVVIICGGVTLARRRTGAMQLAVAVAAILVLFTCRATEMDSRQMELLDKAKMSRIAPDLIEAIPEAIFEASFEAGQISMGNRFTPEQASAAPSGIDFPRTAGAKYTIAMLDPDAPTMSDPKFGPILHWLVVNVEAGDVKAPVDYEKGSELFSYRGPKPPAGSGPHRYVFLAYKQQKTIESPQTLVVPYEDRKNFKIAEFTKQHDLGNPIAINYFLAENPV